MTTATKAILTEALKLKPKDREYLAHALLNTVTVKDDLHLTEAEKADLDRCLKDHEANPEEGISWPELKKEIRKARKNRHTA